MAQPDNPESEIPRLIQLQMTTKSPMRIQKANADPFASVFRRAVSGVGADSRILAFDARALRAALREPAVETTLPAEPEAPGFGERRPAAVAESR